MERPTQLSITLYPVSSYTFGTKPPKFEKDVSVHQRMERLKEKYQREGVRRTVDGVLMVHEHNHPHILLVQVGSSFFKLPGGRLRPGEDEVEGLMRKLNNALAPAAANFKPNWRVGECLATYYRPNFENTVYPYCPAHVTRPKEIKRIWHIILPDRTYFSIPKNMRLVAVPLFEIYDNAQRYGPIIASLPQLLSRFQFILAGGKGVPPALGPPQAAGAAAAAQQQQQHGQPAAYQPPGQQQQQYAHQQPVQGLQQQFAAGLQQQAAQEQQQQQQQQQQVPRMGITVNMQQAPGPAGGALQGMPSGGDMMQGYQQQQQQPAGDDLFVDFDE